MITWMPASFRAASASRAEALIVSAIPMTAAALPSTPTKIAFAPSVWSPSADPCKGRMSIPCSSRKRAFPMAMKCSPTRPSTPLQLFAVARVDRCASQHERKERHDENDATDKVGFGHHELHSLLLIARGKTHQVVSVAQVGLASSLCRPNPFGRRLFRRHDLHAAGVNVGQC